MYIVGDLVSGFYFLLLFYTLTPIIVKGSNSKCTRFKIEEEDDTVLLKCIVFDGVVKQ